VEGHVNRLKTIKRQMYGRANFDLLRARVLYAAEGGNQVVIAAKKALLIHQVRGRTCFLVDSCRDDYATYNRGGDG
jgi:hypothetical protein